MVRKAVHAASLVLHVKQYEGPADSTTNDPEPSQESVAHIEIDSVLSGLKGAREERCVDGLYRLHEDWLFGKVEA